MVWLVGLSRRLNLFEKLRMNVHNIKLMMILEWTVDEALRFWSDLDMVIEFVFLFLNAAKELAITEIKL